MIDRCTNSKAKDYKNYGGRGVSVCEHWLGSFSAFWEDMSDGYSDNMTIERKDVNGNYQPDNCTWVTNAEQQANKRTTRFVRYQGKDVHLSELCRITGMSRCALTVRLNAGMSAEDAIKDYLNSHYGRGRNAIRGRVRERKKSMTSLTVGRVTAS